MKTYVSADTATWMMAAGVWDPKTMCVSRTLTASDAEFALTADQMDRMIEDTKVILAKVERGDDIEFE